MPTIFLAEMDRHLKRKDFAKIMSEFAMQRFRMEPDTKRKCNFTDMDDQTAERKKYARLACQLGVM